MKKRILFLSVAALFSGIVSAQTLFTYGSHAVSAKDFLRAYNKNNTQPVADKAKAMREYLDLYIKSRLKIQEAYDKKMDTLPAVKNEVENLRVQISDNYMNDPEISKRLAAEAFQRSLKDIHVAHIFISFRDKANFTDTISAGKKRDAVLAALEKGEDFLKVAQQYSDDPAAKANSGDLGYITVFTLPYEFENAIYTTPAGKYSGVVRSLAGYHLFKNLGERKAAGKIKAQQILIAFPPGADEAAKKKVKQTADSVYKRIMAGENFNRLASVLSNDYITGAAGGQLPDISVGQFEPAFESLLWSLPKDGAVSKPFLTTHGWHIVKRTSMLPVVTDPNDKLNQQDLMQKIMADNRWKASKDFIYNQVRSKAGFRKFEYNDEALWNMSDSVLDLKPMTSGWAIKSTTPLFAIGDSVYDANDWVSYANMYRYKQDGSGAKPWPQVRSEWTEYSMKEYYRQHLEDFNEDFRYQMQEFKDGNLFFEIMQQQVWNKAQSDSTELLALYEKNKKNYLWNQSADAVVFYCPDELTGKEAYNLVKAKPANWRSVAAMYAEKIVADSSRYEWDQLPNLLKQTPVAGTVTAPLVNKTDNTASFAYIIKVYPQPMQRSYNEAKGLVINDYQVLLEEKWNEALKKKYPVTIDEKVLAGLSK